MKWLTLKSPEGPPLPPNPPPTFRQEVEAVLAEVANVLVAKNHAYGNSALKPLYVFTPQVARNPDTMIRSQMDHKISRLVSGDGSGDEDSLLDLFGYWVLLKVNQRRGETP